MSIFYWVGKFESIVFIGSNMIWNHDNTLYSLGDLQDFSINFSKMWNYLFPPSQERTYQLST